MWLNLFAGCKQLADENSSGKNEENFRSFKISCRMMMIQFEPLTGDDLRRPIATGYHHALLSPRVWRKPLVRRGTKSRSVMSVTATKISFAAVTDGTALMRERQRCEHHWAQWRVTVHHYKFTLSIASDLETYQGLIFMPSKVEIKPSTESSQQHFCQMRGISVVVAPQTLRCVVTRSATSCRWLSQMIDLTPPVLILFRNSRMINEI